MFAKIDNKKIWYDIKGNGKENILVIPHPVYGSRLFELTFYPLEQYARVIYFDPLNTGRTGQANAFQKQTYQDLIKEIESMKYYLGLDNLIILGHSIGGVIALNYAYQFKTNIKKILLISACHALIGMENILEEGFFKRYKDKKYQQVIEDITKTELTKPQKDLLVMYAMHSYEPAKVFQLLKKENGYRDAFNTVFSEHEKILAASEKSLLLNELQLSELEQPVAVIYGNKDLTYNTEILKFFLNKLKKAKITELDNTGHFPWFENEKLFFDELKKIIIN